MSVGAGANIAGGLVLNDVTLTDSVNGNYSGSTSCCSANGCNDGGNPPDGGYPPNGNSPPNGGNPPDGGPPSGSNNPPPPTGSGPAATVTIYCVFEEVGLDSGYGPLITCLDTGTTYPASCEGILIYAPYPSDLTFVGGNGVGGACDGTLSYYLTFANYVNHPSPDEYGLHYTAQEL